MPQNSRPRLPSITEIITNGDLDALKTIHPKFFNEPIEYSGNARGLGQGNYPLHLALEQGHLHIAKFLLANGARLDLTNDFGETPLHVGAKYAACLPFFQALDKDRIPPALKKTFPTPLSSAAESHSSSPELLQQLIALGFPLEHKDKASETPLCCAVRAGRRDHVITLLSHGAPVSKEAIPICLGPRATTEDEVREKRYLHRGLSDTELTPILTLLIHFFPEPIRQLHDCPIPGIPTDSMDRMINTALSQRARIGNYYRRISVAPILESTFPAASSGSDRAPSALVLDYLTGEPSAAPLPEELMPLASEMDSIVQARANAAHRR